MPPQTPDTLDKYKVYYADKTSIDTNQTIQKTHKHNKRKTYTNQEIARNNTITVNIIITTIIIILDITGCNILQYTEGILYISTGFVTGYLYYLEWYNTNNPILWFLKITIYIAWYGTIIGNILVPASGALFLVCGGFLLFLLLE